MHGWMALALVAGLSSAILYYKDLRWLGCLVLLGLPVILVMFLGWPHDSDFIDTSLVSVVFWATLAFIGVGLGTMAVVLRIIR